MRKSVAVAVAEAKIKSTVKTPIIMHFEMSSEAYEKFRNAFDDVRKEIDEGMVGETSEWKALRESRRKLYDLGEIIKKELVIVKDSVAESKITIGGIA